MLLIPAIDLKDGQCVRLQKGDMQKVTVFSNNPSDMATQWASQNAQRLHVVDLDGAVQGRPSNMVAIDAIIQAVGTEVPVQVGGGIRDINTIEQYLDHGVHYVIIGTAAIKNPKFLYEACNAFPEKIIVGLDAKDGKVATDGWCKLTDHDVLDLVKTYEDHDVQAIIYTDINRDGMLEGINIKATQHLAQHTSIPIIASGGLASLKDLDALHDCQDDGVMGVVCGRSIYDGSLDFAQAQKHVTQKPQT